MVLNRECAKDLSECPLHHRDLLPVTKFAPLNFFYCQSMHYSLVIFKCQVGNILTVNKFSGANLVARSKSLWLCHNFILAIPFRPFGFIAPKTLNYLAFQSFGFECPWWRLSDIYVFIVALRWILFTYFIWHKNKSLWVIRSASTI